MYFSFVYSCQTYEGGLGGEPGNEAHGGVTYCGFAALILLNKTDLIDIKRLLVHSVYYHIFIFLVYFLFIYLFIAGLSTLLSE
jgi:prenyltransferase beta subunit